MKVFFFDSKAENLLSQKFSRRNLNCEKTDVCNIDNAGDENLNETSDTVFEGSNEVVVADVIKIHKSTTNQSNSYLSNAIPDEPGTTENINVKDVLLVKKLMKRGRRKNSVTVDVINCSLAKKIKKTATKFIDKSDDEKAMCLFEFFYRKI